MPHKDAEEDKKLFKKMMGKAVKGHAVASHLKKDIKEQKHGIKEDKALMKKVKGKGKY
jgi:hypothetical protein